MSTRRRLLFAGAAALGSGVIARRAVAPSSGPHDTYFSLLNAKAKSLGVPVMLVDLQRTKANAKSICDRVRAAKLALRLVVKSLPSLPLLDALDAGTDRYMVFNTSMLTALSEAKPQADLLLGKPMPIAAVRALPALNPNTTWLIDTDTRLDEYDALARERGVKLRVSLEIEVGLHRGGFTDVSAVAKKLKGHERLNLVGLMGYDAHIGKMPDLLKGRSFDQAQDAYREKIAQLGAAGFDPQQLQLNSAGSMTFARHLAGTVANEIAVGSAFVSPSDFEQPGITPSAFIATPVLKRVSPQIPGIEALSGLRRLVMPETSQGVFVFGGHWLANPVSPPGLGFSDLYGRSSNQELLIASDALQLDIGDVVFYRPTQSEAVLNAFGDLFVVNGEQVERMPVLPA